MVGQGLLHKTWPRYTFQEKEWKLVTFSSDSEVSSLRSHSIFEPSPLRFVCCLYDLSRTSVFKNLLSAFSRSYF